MANIDLHRETEILPNCKYLRFKTSACQNVAKGVFLTASKNQANVQSCSEGCIQGAGTKNEGLRNIGYSISMVLDLFWGANSGYNFIFGSL